MNKLIPIRAFNLSRIVLLFAGIFALSSFFSCAQKNGGKSILLPEEDSQPFSSQWAVVSVPYAVFESNPGVGDSSGTSRMGSVLLITGKKIHYAGKNRNLWYSFEQGWLPDRSIRVYDNRLKAESAAQKLLRQ